MGGDDQHDEPDEHDEKADRQAQVERARRLDRKIEEIVSEARRRRGTDPDAPESERDAPQEPSTPISPREFIARKMRDRARKRPKGSS